MPRVKRTSWLVWLRRASQAAFLALFLFLFLQTAERGSDRPGRGVKLFLEADPLAALAAWLASHALAAGMLLSLATLAVTFFLGRWFCGWICPFGTLHHLFSPRRKLASGRYTPWQKSKYYILAFVAAAALFGANVAGWLDPLAFLFRSLATAVYPALSAATAAVFSWIYDANPGVGALRITALSEPVYEFLRTNVLPVRPAQFSGNVLIGVLFAGAIALNLFRARFWCRYLCPLGALLGVVGKNPLVRLSRSRDACNECGLCATGCQGGADPDTGAWKPAECLYCFNCRSDCPSSAIAIRLTPSRRLGRFSRPPKTERLHLGRRRVLVSGAAGLGAALLFETHPLAAQRSFQPGLVRPPGSLAENAFLSRCVRCGECMKACPTNAIHPAALEAGLEGLWTPVLKMNPGYCEYECTLCTQVCPTGAIQRLETAQKQKIRIGLASIDRNRCLPYAYARPCIVCEEHCPTPKKAIWLEDVDAPAPGGGRIALKQPHIDPGLCIGCGICVAKCVIKGEPAVRISSVSETRNPANGLLL
jgi:polyferredoxin